MKFYSWSYPNPFRISSSFNTLTTFCAYGCDILYPSYISVFLDGNLIKLYSDITLEPRNKLPSVLSLSLIVDK